MSVVVTVRATTLFAALISCPLVMGCGGDSGANTSAPPSAGGAGGAAAGGSGGVSAAGAAGGATVTGGGGGSGGAAGGGEGGAVAGGMGGSGLSGGSGKGGSAGSMGVGGFQTAKHTAFPVIPKFGGPVLVSPQVVTVTYAGYKYAAEVEAFGDFVVTSDWITAVGADYGFAQGTHLAKVKLPDAAPATMSDDELQMFIAAKLADGTLPKPAGNPNDYLYIFYFPKTTKFKRVDGAASCTTFLGFHNGYYSGPTRVAYAVIADCGAEPGVPELGVITSTASHELAEAASDPLPYNNPAFNFGSGSSMDPWRFWGSENGDICAGVDYKHASGNWLQRSWSNANAKLSLDPCVPPAQSDASVFSISAAPSTLQAVNPGQVVTFKLTGWSTNERPDWNLSYSIWRADFMPKIALGASTINNGGVVDLTFTVPNAAASGTLFLMTVESRSGTDNHPWPIGIYVPLHDACLLRERTAEAPSSVEGSARRGGRWPRGCPTRDAPVTRGAGPHRSLSLADGPLYAAPSMASEVRMTAALAGPLVAAQLAQVGLGLGASTALGVLGRGELAGGALGMACFSTALVVCNGLLSPVATLGAESQALGARSRVASMAVAGLVIGWVLSAAVVAGLFHAASLIPNLRGDPATTGHMTAFLAAASWGFPFAVGGLVLRNLATAIGKTTSFAAYATVGALTGTAAAHLAVRGVLGPQARSAFGVGAIIAVAHALVFAAMGVHSFAASWITPVAFTRLRERGDVFKLLLRIGAPVGVLYGLESGMFSITTLWASALGVDAIVAHHIAVQSSYLTFMVPSGIGMATAARVGRAFSRADRPAVVTSTLAGLGAAVLFMAATGIVFGAAPRWVARAFLDVNAPENAAAVSLACRTLAAVAVFQIADAVQGVAAGALRGLRDTKIPMVLGVASYWGIGVALAHVLGVRSGAGVVGLWWGLAAGVVAAAMALSLRLVDRLRRDW